MELPRKLKKKFHRKRVFNISSIINEECQGMLTGNRILLSPHGGLYSLAEISGNSP